MSLDAKMRLVLYVYVLFACSYVSSCALSLLLQPVQLNQCGPGEFRLPVLPCAAQVGQVQPDRGSEMSRDTQASLTRALSAAPICAT